MSMPFYNVVKGKSILHVFWFLFHVFFFGIGLGLFVIMAYAGLFLGG